MEDRERGGIVVGWLVRVAAVLATLGVLVFDVVSIGFAHVGASDTASNAAQLASETYLGTRGDVEAAYAAALGYAEDHGATVPVERFHVAHDGTVELTVEKTATTLLVSRISPLRKLAGIAESAKAKSLPPS